MAEGFVPFATWFGVAPVCGDQPVIAEAELVDVMIDETLACDTMVDEPDAIDEVLADVRRFRAAVADALQVAVCDLLQEIAIDVVARELQLAPVDVRAVVERARQRYDAETVLAIRVNPHDRAALGGEYANVVDDTTLRRGDVVLEVRSGTIDASLGVRLDRAIGRTAPQ
ncbi:MAG: flagellar assembly protein FliH [Candidatus Eremiobacteraeota bacterium]|nr:flagellar assembly protein FliH [Candidatus Eremiobacteraeota bacterium]